MALAVASLILPIAALLPSHGQTPWAGSLALALFFSLVPPFVEELFFRGYVQRRLLQRWPAAVAILITATLFATIHGNLLQFPFAFVLGVWLGVIAWRTGSVWPSMVCHAFWNATVHVVGLGYRYESLSPTLTLGVGVVALGIGLACFVLSIRVLARRPDSAVPAANAESVLTAA
jgi:membrane protease YdiL (CAAX protease family)